VARPEAGSVVVVRFPFSDLNSAKRRPALVLAALERGDFILCQITSNPFSDPRAVRLGEEDFEVGGLPRVSLYGHRKPVGSENPMGREIAGLSTTQ
jgi:mRNA interferase MazF